MIYGDITMNDTDRPGKLTELTPEEIKLINAYRTDPRCRKFLDAFLRPETDEDENNVNFYK